MSAAADWLRGHVNAAPEPLLATMIEALPEAGDLPLPEQLAEGALRLYSRVVRGSGGREDALPLLAADALLTHAFQAQAGEDPEGLGRLAERWGARGRLGEVPL